MSKHDEATMPQHYLSVTGIVIDEYRRVLAIRRQDDGTWVPPGGVLERDETPAEGVIREVLEETGVRVEPEQLTGVYKNMERGIVSLAFRCHPVGGRPHPTDEALTAAWLTLDGLADSVVEARAIRVHDAFRDDGPFVRVHDGRSILRDDEMARVPRP